MFGAGESALRVQLYGVVSIELGDHFCEAGVLENQAPLAPCERTTRIHALPVDSRIVPHFYLLPCLQKAGGCGSCVGRDLYRTFDDGDRRSTPMAINVELRAERAD